jgi:hypothetical protein
VNRTVFRSAIVSGFAAVALLGAANPVFAANGSSSTPPASERLFAPCWSVFNNVTVDGGAASWSISCSNGTDARITGQVTDTKADGKCATIKAFANNGLSRVPLASACPNGKTVKFDWTAPGANDIRAYLYTV